MSFYKLFILSDKHSNILFRHEPEEILKFILLHSCFYQTTFKGRVFMTHPTKAIYRYCIKLEIKDVLFVLMYF